MPVVGSRIAVEPCGSPFCVLESVNGIMAGSPGSLVAALWRGLTITSRDVIMG